MAMASSGVSKDLNIKKFCYPESRIEKKISDCLNIVDALLMTGYDLGSLILIDKGTDSVVFFYEKTNVLFKIKRLDSNKNLSREGLILYYLNHNTQTEIVPKIYMFNNYFIAMKYVDGIKIKDLKKAGLNNHVLKSIVCKILLKAILLDELKVNHGQLSRAYEHIIIRIHDYEPIFIDFGDSSFTDRTKNLTSIWSFLYNQGLLSVLKLNQDYLELAKELKHRNRTLISFLKEQLCSV